MNEILCRQLALDYCCTPEEVGDGAHHFTEHRFLDGRRRFQEGRACFLKIAVVNGKLLFTGQREIVDWCREAYASACAPWFFEAKNLRALNDRLRSCGCQIEMIHPFFIAERPSGTNTDGYEIHWFRDGEIERFRGDARFDEAFAFCADAPDLLGVAALRDGEILGMAGASGDSPTMWQIGINVAPGEEGAGIGTMLVTLLKNEILRGGILPYYGTSLSHLASQRLALAAGFVPAWVELVTSPV